MKSCDPSINHRFRGEAISRDSKKPLYSRGPNTRKNSHNNSLHFYIILLYKIRTKVLSKTSAVNTNSNGHKKKGISKKILVADQNWINKNIFVNGLTPTSFSFIFSLFKQTLQIFTTNICEKSPSSIRCRDLNPQPLERESPPITTRPGLPPK